MASRAQPAKAPPQGAQPGIPPNQTLYVTNLPTKIRKPDLRRSLYILFATYGPVLDVVALKTMKMRGQAHIVFRDIQAATQAMRALQGESFFGMNMKISYAKSKSDTIAKLDGTFRIPTGATAAPETTELQKSIFNAPPSGTTSLPAKPAAPALAAPTTNGTADGEAVDAPSPAGIKRKRDESDAEDQEVPMEDSEDEAAMDVSDEE